MDKLNNSQLILLAILLSFVVSIATGITTVTLMEQAPDSVTVPVTRVVRETVERIVPAEAPVATTSALSAEERKILEDLKAIKPLTVSLYLDGDNQDKLLGTGLFLGDNRVVIASLIPPPAGNEVYIVKSVLGEQKVASVVREKDFTIVELVAGETELPPANGQVEGVEDENDSL